MLGVVVGTRVVHECRHHRCKLRLVELVPGSFVHRHGDNQVAFAEKTPQTLTRIGDFVSGQKAETFEHRADTVELGGHGTRLGVDR